MLKVSPRYPASRLFSRQDLQAATGISDDVLGYWFKEGLLAAVPASNRSHRRFQFDQANIAVVLEAMRRLGANIGVLRKFAEILQHGKAVASEANELDHMVARLCGDLARILGRFDDGHTVEIYNEEWLKSARDGNHDLDIPSLRPAKSRQEIIDDWLYINAREGDVKAALPFATSLTSYDAFCFDAYIDLINPEIVGERLPDWNWVWLTWIDQSGKARIYSGEDASPSLVTDMPVSAFYISVSRLIRPLWVKEATA
ncbi:helix-turn-helix domain-containing protein [Novosphingobium sp. B1]|uniref:helix-turn-helix domain-containing protein n=1 Tax=Novosphingobium sp. B1 TaxID=1938756 RepID=UPI0009D7AF2D|nr:helix-turn-helix domain-containing protein [Novosphingobium sp. B1]SMC75975.1 DNA-binding transcriptional regulator, MerR family [Novosphingobium sp. B1]